MLRFPGSVIRDGALEERDELSQATPMHDVYINGLGAFLPGEPVASKDMEDHIGRIGGVPCKYKSLILRQNRIKTRHYALNRTGEATHSNSEMAANAIADAIRKSEINAKDISFLATSTTLGDLLVPGLASHVHAQIKIPPIEIANFQSVCASSLMAVKAAYLQLRAGEHTCAAVSGSEFASRYFRPGFYEGTRAYQQTGEVPLEAAFLRFTLSDGAGAAILETRPNQRQLSLKIRWINLRSYADRFDTCMMGGGVRRSGSIDYWGDHHNAEEAMKQGAIILVQDFELMKRMIPVWVSHYLGLIDEGLIKIAEIDHVVSHYSAHSLKEEVVKLLTKAGAMIDEGKWFSNLSTKGNTGAASIFILLEELYHSGTLKAGETILCHVPESGRALNGFMLLEVV
jgi:3-oxoacyl-[acyl-carrier-protein] synthase III